MDFHTSFSNLVRAGSVRRAGRAALALVSTFVFAAALAAGAAAQEVPSDSAARGGEPASGRTTGARHAGGEANLVLPDLASEEFLGVDGHTLLLVGIVVCALGLGFGLWIYTQLKNLPVHGSMREISELIYETCKTYLVTQGKFIMILWLFIGAIAAVYFGFLAET
ncbi:MAG: hypothetical protein LC800_07275, partial [Acidobacteria bacterium]|nr:hypothetical protein [Acidobacteriota bacterium]